MPPESTRDRSVFQPHDGGLADRGNRHDEEVVVLDVTEVGVICPQPIEDRDHGVAVPRNDETVSARGQDLMCQAEGIVDVPRFDRESEAIAERSHGRSGSTGVGSEEPIHPAMAQGSRQRHGAGLSRFGQRRITGQVVSLLRVADQKHDATGPISPLGR